jgi:hypothetical protein
MIMLPPQAPQFPPFVWLHVFSLAACCGAFVLLLYACKLRRVNSMAGLPRIAALTILASLCVFEASGCGGAGVSASASPQVVPTPHVIGTPQGTSTITLTPSVTTSAGIPLQGIPPVQLTLTVQ